jgi:hypothetical protein
MGFWRALDSPNVQRFINAITILGLAGGAGLWVWDRIGAIAGWVGVVIAALAAVSVAFIAIGVGYYVLLFVRSRGWFGVPVRHIHHVSLSATVKPTGTLETKVTRAKPQESAQEGPAPDRPTEPSVVQGALANSPHLMWSGAHAVKPGYYGEVNVLCTNVGGVAQVMPDSWVTSSVKLPDGTEQSEPIAFSDFDTQGQVLPGAFTLRMEFGRRDPIPGDRTVTWRVVYMDDDLTHGFITECSVDVRFVLDKYEVVGRPRLDISSRRTRNDDYNEYYREKRAPSTGRRRPHPPGADGGLERYRPPSLDLDAKQRAEEAFETSQKVDVLLEEADAISELLRRDQLDGTRLDRWTSDADHFVALNFHTYATEFRIAREPQHVRLSGAHTDRIWLPLKRLAAQMEVLQEIKRDLRGKRDLGS